MKVAGICILSCILAGMCLQAQLPAALPNKRYQTWIIPRFHEPVRNGVLFKIIDSSILISNSGFTFDYEKGYYCLSELGVDRIEMVKVRKEDKLSRGIMIGGIVGAATGLTSALIWYGTTSSSEFFGDIFNVVGAMLITIAGTGLGIGVGIATTGFKINIPIHGSADEFNRQREKLNKYSYTEISKVPIPEPRIILKTDQKVTDQDGNIYSVVSAGGKLWMGENLKTAKYANGDPILAVQGAAEWSKLKEGAYCDPMNSGSRVNVYGRLYNRYAAEDPRNICPHGWHVPSFDEWASLVDTLGGVDAAGGVMQDTELAKWSKTNKGDAPYKAFAVLSGSRNRTGEFIAPGNTAHFWWSQQDNQEVIIGLLLERKRNDVRYLSRDAGDNAGMSVRCVKD